jgi:hypothetical protein
MIIRHGPILAGRRVPGQAPLCDDSGVPVRPLRRVLAVLAWCAACWPQYVVAATGHPAAVNLVLVPLVGGMANRIVADRATKARTGWDADEVRDRIAAARRGVVPEDPRERRHLDFLLRRQWDWDRAFPWFVGTFAAALVAFDVVLLVRSHPLVALVAALWFAALAAVVLLRTRAGRRREMTELETALRHLATADPVPPPPA